MEVCFPHGLLASLCFITLNDCFCFRWKRYETTKWRDVKMRLRLQIGKEVKDSSYLLFPCLDHHIFHIPLQGKTQICKMDQTRATLSASQRHSRKTWWAVAFLLLTLIPRFLCESCWEKQTRRERTVMWATAKSKWANYRQIWWKSSKHKHQQQQDWL